MIVIVSHRRRNRHDQAGREQGPRAEGVRHIVQQARLRHRMGVLVTELHPAQRAHQTGPRGPVRTGQNHPGHFEIGSTTSSSRKATTSSSMAASPAMAGRPHGSPPTSSASRTEGSPSTGTSSRTKRHAPSPRAACRCSATSSRKSLRQPDEGENRGWVARCPRSRDFWPSRGASREAIRAQAVQT